MTASVLGHFAMRPLGGFRVHLIQVVDDNPGGVHLSAVCGGIQQWVRVNSGIAPSEWEGWKAAQAPIKGWPEWSEIARVDCPRCETTYNKRRARRKG